MSSWLLKVAVHSVVRPFAQAPSRVLDISAWSSGPRKRSMPSEGIPLLRSCGVIASSLPFGVAVSAFAMSVMDEQSI